MRQLVEGSHGPVIHGDVMKLTVPARECGDVSALVGHAVRVVRVVHDTKPKIPRRGVRFVVVEHDEEQCRLNGECSREERERELAEADELANKLETKTAELNAGNADDQRIAWRMERLIDELRWERERATDPDGKAIIGVAFRIRELVYRAHEALEDPNLFVSRR